MVSLSLQRAQLSKKIIYSPPSESSYFNDLTSGLFHLNSLDRPISNLKDVRLVFITTMFYRFFYILTANSVDPDQTPHLHLRRLIWIYTVCQYPFYGILGINGLKLPWEVFHERFFFFFLQEGYLEEKSIGVLSLSGVYQFNFTRLLHRFISTYSLPLGWGSPSWLLAIYSPDSGGSHQFWSDLSDYEGTITVWGLFRWGQKGGKWL